MKQARPEGALIVNADDWGRNRQTTQPILDCLRKGSVSAVSAMVFMEDSERAAAVARESKVDAGLHLNLTAAFSGAAVPQALADRQGRIASYLLRHRLARVWFHPTLGGCFEYVVRAQLEEYERLYGHSPQRIDGHHHMHLCANVLVARLLPPETVARRNFSFQAGEKSWWNRYYRGMIDRNLARRHRLVDFLFSLAPLEPASRLQHIFASARHQSVELETHPVNPAEYEFLMQGEFERRLGDLHVASGFALIGRAGPDQSRC
ncbi:MAG TPA: ChbG/HpnK family deacetylase [Candidatus Aquilonibacter sp.]|nr:ChbG/HpnK family deacetylase [Candidatus Aquilonibacter sp.]